MKIVEKLMTYDLIITDSHVMTPNGMVEKNIVIDSGKIKLITGDAVQEFIDSGWCLWPSHYPISFFNS